MNREEYTEKVEISLRENQFKELKKNPLNAYNTKVRKILSTKVYMYGVIKLHKQNYPVRPVVSSV